MAEAGPAGWVARLALRFEQRAGRTVLAHRSHEGPLAVQKPFYPEGDVCHVYLLHPPGGVVGGDRLTIEIEVASDAHAVITTPAAGKFYRSAAVESVALFSATLLESVLLCRYLGDSAESARRCFTMPGAPFGPGYSAAQHSRHGFGGREWFGMASQ